MMTKTYTFLFAFLMALHFQSRAQEAVNLSLAEALQQASENNTQSKVKTLEAQQAKFGYQKTNSLFLPKVSLSETGIRTDNPLMAFGFLLQQRQVQASDFNPTLLNDPGNRVNWQTQVLVEQPILNADGFYGRKAAKQQVLATEKMAERTDEFIAYKVKETYFGLLIAQQHKQVVEQALKTTDKALKIATNNYEQGYLKQVDLTKIRLRKLELENQLMDTENMIAQTNDYLSFMITGTTGTTYQLTDSLYAAESIEVTANLEERADIQAMSYMEQAQSYQVKMSKAQFVPRVNAFGQYNLNSDQLLGDQASNYLIGISLNWKLFDGGNNVASVKQSSTAMELAGTQLDAKKQEAQIEFNQAQRNVILAKSKLEQLQLAQQEAQASFQIVFNQFEEGMANAATLLEAETLLSSKKLEYQNGLYEYYLAMNEVSLLAN